MCVGKINLSKRKCCFHSIEDAGTREEELIFTNGLQNLPVDQYLLTPGNGGNLTSLTVKLNDAPLALINDTFLPDIQPKRILTTRKQIALPSLSYAFFVIAQANAMEANQLDILMIWKNNLWRMSFIRHEAMRHQGRY